MKYEFNDSNFVKLWTEEDVFRSYVNESKFLRMETVPFWKTQFIVDSTVTPTDAHGISSFGVSIKRKEQAPLMDWRAPLGKGKDIEKPKEIWYNGSIPNLIAPSMHENAAERAYKVKMYEQYGDDAKYLIDWADSVMTRIESSNNTLSNMAAQIISTGKINWNFGRGIKDYMSDARLIAENIVKAGTESSSLAWTDPSCKILDQMASIEKKFRDDNGYGNIPMKWQIVLDMFQNQFMKNEQIRNFIKDYRTNNALATTDGFVATVDEFNNALRLYSAISPIEIIVEQQKDYTGIVNGWKKGIAVLRPRGYAGLIKHADSLDEFMSKKFGAQNITKNFSRINDVCTLINTTLDNGDYKEWHTDLIMDAVPVLDEVPYHLIVDTNKAGKGTTTLE